MRDDQTVAAAGCDPNGLDKDSRSPLSHVAANGKGDITTAIQLIEGGANLNLETERDATTPLMHAAQSGDYEMCALFIKHGALVRCAFFDKHLHLRMTLVPTPARLK